MKSSRSIKTSGTAATETTVDDHFRHNTHPLRNHTVSAMHYHAGSDQGQVQTAVDQGIILSNCW